MNYTAIVALLLFAMFLLSFFIGLISEKNWRYAIQFAAIIFSWVLFLFLILDMIGL